MNQQLKESKERLKVGRNIKKLWKERQEILKSNI
jgi:hypothetical protein